MIRKSAILISIVSIIYASFFSPWIAWGIMGVATSFYLLTYIIFKIWRCRPVKELSKEANQILKKYGYLYHLPQEDDDLSDGADKLAWGGVILAVLCVFKMFWWGILFGTAMYFIMGFMAKVFNWKNYAVNYKEVVAHDEILTYMEKKELEQEWKKNKKMNSVSAKEIEEREKQRLKDIESKKKDNKEQAA